MGTTCNTHGAMRNVYKILVWKLDGKKNFRGIDKNDNIKMCLKQTVCEVMEWIQFSQYRIQ
jgi:hypothetical protein